MKNDIAAEIETMIDAPVSNVWKALTNPEIIKKYFFGTNTISNWKVGSPITFKGEWEGKSYEDKGTILDIKTNKILKYNDWSPMSGIEDKPENYIVLTYELEEKGNETKLTLRQENIPTIEMKEHSEKNWKMVLDNLKDLLEKQTV